jgi:anti-anti-sigma factor
VTGSPPLHIRHLSTSDGVAVVAATGEIDLANVLEFRDAMAPAEADPELRLLVCDLSRVAFVSCSALSTLLDVMAVLGARGARLRVVAHGPAVLRPLSVTGLLDVLPVSPDLAAALR